MTRRSWLIAAASFAACAPAPRPDDELAPASVAGWRRARLERIEKPGARRALDARYEEGGRRLDVQVLELASSALALDMAQRWKPVADTVFFYKDRYFVIVRWAGVSQQDLNAFITALEKNFDRIK